MKNTLDRKKFERIYLSWPKDLRCSNTTWCKPRFILVELMSEMQQKTWMEWEGNRVVWFVKVIVYAWRGSWWGQPSKSLLGLLGLQKREDFRDNDFWIQKASFKIMSNLHTKYLSKVFIEKEIACSLSYSNPS